MGVSIFQSMNQDIPVNNAVNGNAMPLPFQQLGLIQQAMVNPQAYIKHMFFPDIPNNILNDSSKVLKYIQQTRGITDQQLQQIVQNYGPVLSWIGG